jgi:cytochrome c biogenesis protein CcdA
MRWLTVIAVTTVLLVVLAGRVPVLASQPVAFGAGPLLAGDPPPAPEADNSPPIHVAYISQAGCPVCSKANATLEEVEGLYPQMVLTEFPIEEEQSKMLSEWLGQQYGVPEEKRLTTPAIFVGSDHLVGRDEVTLEALRTVLDTYAESGAQPTWVGFDSARSEASIFERFRSFGALTVLGAGLLDGLNPCAFATIVFFVSYLAFMERKGREILAVGGAFALGVFLTYLLVGVGLLSILEQLVFLTTLRPWVYGLTAVLCLILAAFSFLDYRKAQGGDFNAMALRIPLRLRQRINRTVRSGAKAQAFVPVAFVTGMAISLLELACTGQVYLPTILFVMGRPEMKGQAFLYLVLYNLAFVLPLIAVFGLAYFGTTSEQLGRFIHRRTAAVKLATGVLFVILAGWLIYGVVQA